MNRRRSKRSYDIDDIDTDDNILKWVEKRASKFNRDSNSNTLTIDRDNVKENNKRENNKRENNKEENNEDEYQELNLDSKSNKSTTWFLKYIAVIGTLIITAIIVFWIISFSGKNITGGLKKGEALLYVGSPEYSVGADVGLV